MLTNEQPGIEWAGFMLPTAMAKDHFCIVGAPGSGKTLQLHSLIRSVVSQILPGTDRRAIIFDTDGNAQANLASFGSSCRVRVLNPFDANVFIWDIAADVSNEFLAERVAHMLLPVDANHGAGEYFTRAARHMLSGIFCAFIADKRAWTLQDILSASSSMESISQLASSDSRTADLIAPYLTSKAATADILGTISNSLAHLKEIAAVSANVPLSQRFSIADWARNENSVLVVPGYLANRRGFEIFMQLFLDVLFTTLLAGPERIEDPNTWMFIEEFHAQVRTANLPQLLADGRSKGVCMAMTTQDIESVLHTYGDKIGWEILSMCLNVSFLRITNRRTAEWASEMTSRLENFEYQPRNREGSITEGGFSKMAKKDKSLRPRPPYHPSEFAQLPISSDGRVTGCHIIPALGGSVLRETRHRLPTTP